jgi:hypothetical protein
MACAPVWAQAQSLEALIQDALATHPSTQSQRAQVASAMAGVESALWQFDPLPSVALENAATRSSDPLCQGDKRVTTLPYGTACLTTIFRGRATPPSLTQRVNAEPPRPAAKPHSMAYT